MALGMVPVDQPSPKVSQCTRRARGTKTKDKCSRANAATRNTCTQSSNGLEGRAPICTHRECRNSKDPAETIARAQTAPRIAALRTTNCVAVRGHSSPHGSLRRRFRQPARSSAHQAKIVPQHSDQAWRLQRGRSRYGALPSARRWPGPSRRHHQPAPRQARSQLLQK